MDENDDSWLVRVRADQAAFRRDVAGMREALVGELSGGAEAAGRGIAAALGRAARDGRVEFQELAKIAAKALGEIAAAALKVGPATAPLAGGTVSALVGAIGLPGRATGGMVAPGRAYVVGERGPELFVPTASGRIDAAAGERSERPIQITVHVAPPAGGGQDWMAMAGRQIARDVHRALRRAASDGAPR